MTNALKAPFPWFGGKSKVAPVVWRAFAGIENYVEPFAGSLAVLLAAPAPVAVETVNDADGLLANFWRALRAAPEAVAYFADWPANECDLHARHLWLLAHRERITEHLMGDPDYYDVKAAGWWVWGLSLWIGGGWCSGKGPWHSVDGQLVKGDSGMGVHRQSLQLGDPGSYPLGDYLAALSARLRRVRVACGDWSRVTGGSVLQPKRGCPYGVFLDPPYAEKVGMEYSGGHGDVAVAVRAWAIEQGADPCARIALCTYSDEPMPDGWTLHRWKTAGGYANQSKGQSAGPANRDRERIWFSPQCAAIAEVQG